MMKRLFCILLLALLCSPAALADDPAPYAAMRSPIAAPVFLPVAPVEQYVCVQNNLAPVRAKPQGGTAVRVRLKTGDLLAIAPMPETYQGDKDAAKFVPVLLPEGAVGFIAQRDVRPIAAAQQPAYAIDPSCARFGYIHAAAQGDGHLMLVIQNGEQKHQLLLPNDGQWHAMLLTLGPGLYDVSIDEVGPQDIAVRTVYMESLPEVTPPTDQELALLSGLHTEVAATPELAAFARQLCEGAATDTERFARIRDWLYRHAKYDRSFASAIQYTKIPVPQDFLPPTSAPGICSDYAAFIAICCRAVGIPCQHVYGINPKTNNEHAWNLVWLDGAWQLCDVVADQSSRRAAFVPLPPESYPRKAGYWDGFH